MIEVKSSAIRGVEMGSDGLRVTFTSGKSYDYEGVSDEQMHEMISSESPGRYFAQKIKPNHKAVPVDDGPGVTEDDAKSNSPEDLGFGERP